MNANNQLTLSLLAVCLGLTCVSAAPQLFAGLNSNRYQQGFQDARYSAPVFASPTYTPAWTGSRYSPAAYDNGFGAGFNAGYGLGSNSAYQQASSYSQGSHSSNSGLSMGFGIGRR